MGRVSLCLVIMFFICSAQKIDAQVQNIREKQDTIHFRELKKMHDQVMEALPVKRRQIYELSFNHA